VTKLVIVLSSWRRRVGWGF